MDVNKLRKLAGLEYTFESPRDQKRVIVNVPAASKQAFRNHAETFDCRLTKAPGADTVRVSGPAVEVERLLEAFRDKATIVNEGFFELTVGGSDTAADLMDDVLTAAARVLENGLKYKGNKYNTPGYLNVAMIIVENFKEHAWHRGLHNVAKRALDKMEKNEAEWTDASDKKAYNKILQELRAFVSEY